MYRRVYLLFAGVQSIEQKSLRQSTNLCTIPHCLNDKPDYESYAALTLVC